MKNMRFLTLLLAGVLALTSCEKEEQTKDDFGSHPRTEVPASLTGQWIYGSFSLSSVVDNNGTWSAEYGLTYVIDSRGNCREYFQYSSMPSYGQMLQVRGLRRGTVTVDAAAKMIRFYAANGWYDVRRNFSSVERKQYGEADLYPAYFKEYRYENTTDGQGRPALRLIDINGTNTAGLLYTKS